MDRLVANWLGIKKELDLRGATERVCGADGKQYGELYPNLVTIFGIHLVNPSLSRHKGSVFGLHQTRFTANGKETSSR